MNRTVSLARYCAGTIVMFFGGVAFAAAWHDRAYLGWHTVWIVTTVAALSLWFAFWRRRHHPQ